MEELLQKINRIFADRNGYARTRDLTAAGLHTTQRAFDLTRDVLVNRFCNLLKNFYHSRIVVMDR